MKFAILFRKKDLKGAKIPKFSIFENYNFYFLSNFDVFFVVVGIISYGKPRLYGNSKTDLNTVCVQCSMKTIDFKKI
jgi:hypothetical protein